MIKVNITDSIKSEYLKLFNSIWQNEKLIKKSDNKIKWEITKNSLNSLIKKKLKTFDEKIDLEKLILADFEYLEELVKFIDTNKKRVELSSNEKDYFLTLYQRLKKAEYVKLLNVSVCLYCNRSYIYNFKKAKSTETTAQLDHFFDKKTYPYLAVSIYNLVPCCVTCNQRKSSKKLDIIHPFVDSFDNLANFVLKIDSSEFYRDKKAFEIELKSNNIKAKNSIEAFNLNRLYQNHKDIVLELIQKNVMYSESYLDELITKYEGTLFKNKEDLQRLLSGGYISNEEIGKRPLSKLIKDISQELGLV